jgi:hypothetical protein
MDGYCKHVIQGLGTVVLCTGVAVQVFSSPPVGKATHPGSGAIPTRLDLRPPVAREPPAAREFPSLHTARLTNEAPRGARSMAHVSSDGLNSSDRFNDLGGEERFPSSLRFSVGQARSMSRAETFARRFHREGLPLARLWETNSALVSLGLNQKGKPGLWLVQKTH